MSTRCWTPSPSRPPAIPTRRGRSSSPAATGVGSLAAVPAPAAGCHRRPGCRRGLERRRGRAAHLPGCRRRPVAGQRPRPSRDRRGRDGSAERRRLDARRRGPDRGWRRLRRHLQLRPAGRGSADRAPGGRRAPAARARPGPRRDRGRRPLRLAGWPAAGRQRPFRGYRRRSRSPPAWRCGPENRSSGWR